LFPPHSQRKMSFHTQKKRKLDKVLEKKRREEREKHQQRQEEETPKQQHDAINVRLLGDPILRKRAIEVEDVHDEVFIRERKQLEEALECFRRENGFGRGIAAPQIGMEP